MPCAGMSARLDVAGGHLGQRGKAAGDAHELRRNGGADGSAQVGRDPVHPRLQSTLLLVLRMTSEDLQNHRRFGICTGCLRLQFIYTGKAEVKVEADGRT